MPKKRLRPTSWKYRQQHQHNKSQSSVPQLPLGWVPISDAIMASAAASAEAVCLDYHDLVSGKDLSAEIERAYGYDGLGILTVKNIPELVQKKMQLLPLAWR